MGAYTLQPQYQSTGEREETQRFFCLTRVLFTEMLWIQHVCESNVFSAVSLWSRFSNDIFEGLNNESELFERETSVLYKKKEEAIYKNVHTVLTLWGDVERKKERKDEETYWDTKASGMHCQKNYKSFPPSHISLLLSACIFSSTHYFHLSHSACASSPPSCSLSLAFSYRRAPALPPFFDCVFPIFHLPSFLQLSSLVISVPLLPLFSSSSSVSPPPSHILRLPPPPPPPMLHTHNLPLSYSSFFFFYSLHPHAFLCVSSSISSPWCVMITARLATAAAADSRAVGAGGGREGWKEGIWRWWGSRVGGGCYFFVGRVLIFEKTETNMSGPAESGWGAGTGCSTSHGSESSLCWCTIGSLPCQSSCRRYLSHWHIPAETDGRNQHWGGLVVPEQPAALEEQEDAAGRCWGGVGGVSLWFAGTFGRDSLTWCRGNSCNTLQATPVSG